jgi:hypothetical protein
MENFLKLLPVIVGFFLFLAGLLAWRQQLLDKRKFEVAEQVLVAYAKVAEALRVLRERNPYAGSSEWIAAQRPENNYRHYLARRDWMYRIPEKKLEAFEAIYKELSPAEVLASVYLSTPIVAKLVGLKIAFMQVKKASRDLMSIHPSRYVDPQREDDDAIPETDYDDSDDPMTPEEELALEKEQLPIRFVGPIKDYPDTMTALIAQNQMRLHELCQPYTDINPYSFLFRLCLSLFPRLNLFRW